MSAVVGNMAIDGAQRMRGAIGDTRRQRAQGVAAHLGAATGHKARADNFPLTFPLQAYIVCPGLRAKDVRASETRKRQTNVATVVATGSLA